jgi:membrane associated rhomboid family serine protease
MLEDRDYMREPDFRGRSFGGFPWSWTVALIVSYVVVLVTQLLAFRFAPERAYEWYGYLALSRDGLAHGYVWQLVTYQFMHTGWLHLIFNSWALYVFGRELESVLGVRKYLALIFSSGIVGGLLQIGMSLILPKFFGGAVVGASAGVFGLLAAFAAMFPERQITLLVFFVIPVTLTAVRLLLVSAVVAIAGFFFPSNVANAAHLGGMAMGWVFIRNILQGDWSGFADRFRPLSRRRTSSSASKMIIEDPEPSVDEDVDRILDKISAQGIQSLTAHERSILESARKKMSRK